MMKHCASGSLAPHPGDTYSRSVCGTEQAIPPSPSKDMPPSWVTEPPAEHDSPANMITVRTAFRASRAVSSERITQCSNVRASTSLTNDLLLACSARRMGAFVVTDNRRDFSTIQAHVAVRFGSLDEVAAATG